MSRSPARAFRAVRLVVFTLSVLTAFHAALTFASLLALDGWGLLETLLLVLFGVLFVLLATSFWTATLGFALCLVRRPRVSPVPTLRPGNASRTFPRTAVVMPVHNEDPPRVFSGLKTIHESLQTCHDGPSFDFFVLSDTTDPEIWLEEELGWANLIASSLPQNRFFYRRRDRNVQRKSGNIADFCRRWGANYTYMIVLDADSVMEGETIVEMVRRMEQDPELGILQVPTLPVNASSLFSMKQAFAASLYGKIFTTGYAEWAQDDANYWGHNAIIRVDPFMRHCGLPTLPGRAPFGGEILSHDFVEAAFMRRAGWKVRVADDLEGSYEECPATLLDFAKRDQRWSQGNLQHLRLVFAQGLDSVTRVQLAIGAMSYLAAPLWLLFMVLGVLRVSLSDANPPSAAFYSLWVIDDGGSYTARVLLAETLALLFLPKLWSYVILVLDPKRVIEHGGVFTAATSLILETVVSALVAPILMAFHTQFVISALLGRGVTWTAQRRGGVAMSFREAAAAHATQTYWGVIAGLGVTLLAPSILWWLAPVFGGLVLSIPLSMALSSPGLTQYSRSRRIFLTPEESSRPMLLERQAIQSAAFEAALKGSRLTDRFSQVVLDPAFNELHCALLGQPRRSGRDDSELERLRWISLYGRSQRLGQGDKMELLKDGWSLQWLHRRAWIEWPLEILDRAVAASEIYSHLSSALSDRRPLSGGSEDSQHAAVRDRGREIERVAQLAGDTTSGLAFRE